MCVAINLERNKTVIYMSKKTTRKRKKGNNKKFFQKIGNRTGYGSEALARKYFNAFVDALIEEAMAEGKVTIDGFGTFTLVQRGGREITSHLRGYPETYYASSYYSLKYNATPAMLTRLNGGVPQTVGRRIDRHNRKKGITTRATVVSDKEQKEQAKIALQRSVRERLRQKRGELEVGEEEYKI